MPRGRIRPVPPLLSLDCRRRCFGFRRPRRRAATPTLPEPMNGSATSPPASPADRSASRSHSRTPGTAAMRDTCAFTSAERMASLASRPRTRSWKPSASTVQSTPRFRSSAAVSDGQSSGGISASTEKGISKRCPFSHAYSTAWRGAKSMPRSVS